MSWDEDVLRNIGKGDMGDLLTFAHPTLSSIESDADSQFLSTPGSMVQPSISFTPINRTGASPRAANSLRTLQNADLYDIPHSPVTPTVNPPTNSKKGAPASRRAQSKAAIANLTEAHMTNLQNDHEVIEVSSPKRRKTPMKRAQSMKAFKVPSKIQTPTGSGKKQVYPDECSRPQLVSRPDTNKKLNKRGISVIQNSTKSSELFQSSNVSNALAAKGKSGRDVPRSINSLQGFITTEDQLKFNSNGIANTTLQKLAAFRYMPVEENSTSDIQECESDAPHIHADLEQDQALQSPGEVDNTPLDYGHMPINDSFFNEALWRDDNQHQSVEAAFCVENSSSGVMSEEPMNYTSSTADGTWHDSEHGAQIYQQDIPPLELQAVESSRSLLVHQLTHGKMNVLSQQFSAVDIMNKNSVVKPLESAEDSSPVGVPTEYVSISPRHIINSDTRHSLTINHLADENLDDDLPDEDLLAFFDDTRVPESPVVSPGTGLVKCTEAAVCTREAPHLQPSPTSQEQGSAASLPVETDEEDEYPMDEDFEDAISKLPGLHIGVIETFHPAPSIEIPADDTCTDKEVYDNTLQFSSPRSLVSELEDMAQPVSANMSRRLDAHVLEVPATSEEADWSYIMSKTPALANTIGCQSTTGLTQELILPTPSEPPPVKSANTNKVPSCIDDSHEYRPLLPFARPQFPMLVRDRCPVDGLTAKTFLRVCFRIGEMLKEGGRCNALGQDAIIELFARVTFSSREFGTTKQHFQFADLFHDRPPFAKGILAHFNPTRLVDAESRVFLESGQPLIARCLGSLRKDLKSGGWLLHIINVRVTDWEEIRWTKRIVSADHDEKVKLARLRAEASFVTSYKRLN
ncbi:hypothetical protein CJF31_00005454 [Rutstroemia sp. NJR-2017a BVV2]|nr:hypothetical protein CJF31_00005454 [Rutstroemia sp. NJR-2017a BVV2]